MQRSEILDSVQEIPTSASRRSKSSELQANWNINKHRCRFLHFKAIFHELFYFLATAWHLIKAVEWGLAGDVWRVLLECDEGCIGTTKNKLERSLSRKTTESKDIFFSEIDILPVIRGLLFDHWFQFKRLWSNYFFGIPLSVQTKCWDHKKNKINLHVQHFPFKIKIPYACDIIAPPSSASDRLQKATKANFPIIELSPPFTDSNRIHVLGLKGSIKMRLQMKVPRISQSSFSSSSVYSRRSQNLRTFREHNFFMEILWWLFVFISSPTSFLLMSPLAARLLSQ